MTEAKQLTAVSAEVPAVHVDAVLEALADTPFSPTAWEDVERGTCRVDLFLEDASTTAVAIESLRRVGADFSLELNPVVSTVAPEDWAESWKRFFHVGHVSPRVVVRPIWEPYQARAGEVVIDIEPGMSFGTGRHGTTRACLVFLDRIAAERGSGSVLDMGCGSGILAIGASKLGFKPVHGFDNDADAVAIAHENAAQNGVTIPFFHRDLAACNEQADVVVANILAPVLIQYAAVIARAVLHQPDSALIVSGILAEQYDAVLAAFVRHGFAERENLTIEGWRSGWLQRPVLKTETGTAHETARNNDR